MPAASFGLLDAVVSPCGRYRPWLQRRELMLGGGRCVFVMLNPSTADAEIDDPTIRRCRGFARRERAERLIVVNLFTARATKPSALYDIDDPVGPDADSAIEDAFQYAQDEADGDRVICAWGAMPAKAPAWFQRMHRDRFEAVLAIAARNLVTLWALGFTSDGHPRHPLYLKADAPLVRFTGASATREKEVAP